MFHVLLKILEGSILLKDEISVVLRDSLAGPNFSIKTNSFSILQLINLIVKIPFVCVYVSSSSYRVPLRFLDLFFFSNFANSLVKSICLLLICKHELQSPNWYAIRYISWNWTVEFFTYRFFLRDDITWDCGYGTFFFAELSKQFLSECLPYRNFLWEIHQN